MSIMFASKGVKRKQAGSECGEVLAGVQVESHKQSMQSRDYAPRAWGAGTVELYTLRWQHEECQR